MDSPRKRERDVLREPANVSRMPHGVWERRKPNMESNIRGKLFQRYFISSIYIHISLYLYLPLPLYCILFVLSSDINIIYLIPISIYRSIYKHLLVDDMCLEERVFYKLISGLHTSISTHIAKYYQLNETDGHSDWISNPEVFKEKVGNYPERMDNLYFAYLFLLR